MKQASVVVTDRVLYAFHGVGTSLYEDPSRDVASVRSRVSWKAAHFLTLWAQYVPLEGGGGALGRKGGSLSFHSPEKFT